MAKKKSVLQQYDELIALRPSFGKRRVQLTVAQAKEARIRMEEVLHRSEALLSLILDRVIQKRTRWEKSMGGIE